MTRRDALRALERAGEFKREPGGVLRYSAFADALYEIDKDISAATALMALRQGEAADFIRELIAQEGGE